MHSKKVLNLLSDYQAIGENQRQFKKRMISFIEGNPFCFESQHPPKRGAEAENEWGHVTGSAWVLNPSGDAVLLTHHKKLNKWLQLGGHSDGEWDVIKTAQREAQEESGINEIAILSEAIFDIDIHVFPKKKEKPEHLHYDIRFLLQAKQDNFVVSEESHNLKWIPLKEISIDQFEESIVRMAQKTFQFTN